MSSLRTETKVSTRWNSARLPDPDLHRLLRLLFGDDHSAAPSGAVDEGGRRWCPQVPLGPTGAGGATGGSLTRPHRGGAR